MAKGFLPLHGHQHMGRMHRIRQPPGATLLGRLRSGFRATGGFQHGIRGLAVVLLCLVALFCMTHPCLRCTGQPRAGLVRLGANSIEEIKTRIKTSIHDKQSEGTRFSLAQWFQGMGGPGGQARSELASSVDSADAPVHVKVDRTDSAHPPDPCQVQGPLTFNLPPAQRKRIILETTQGASVPELTVYNAPLYPAVPRNESAPDASSCSKHSIIVPFAHAPPRFTLKDIIFGMATTAEHLYHMTFYWKLWAQNPLRCLIIVPWEDESKIPDLKFHLKANNIGCNIRSSKIPRYEERYFSLIKELTEETQTYAKLNDGAATKWFIFGDDDTMWFEDNLLDVLSRYDSDRPYYIGDWSEATGNQAAFGRFVYGGGGVVFSAKMMALVHEKYPFCYLKHKNTFGGDGMLGKCVGLTLELPMTREPGFNQMDIKDDAYGLIQRGLSGIVSLHHFAFWLRLFPLWHVGDNKIGMGLMKKAHSVLGGENFLRRYAWVDHEAGTTSVFVNGYSLTEYSRILPVADLNKAEWTWDPTYNLDMPTRPTIEEGKGKTNFFLMDVMELSDKSFLLTFTNVVSDTVQMREVIWRIPTTPVVQANGATLSRHD